jgi:O-antigen ligase
MTERGVTPGARIVPWGYWALIAPLLVAAGLTGSLASVLSLVVALLICLGLLLSSARQEVWVAATRPPLLFLTLPFVVLAICFAITADAPSDLLFVFNFIALALAPAVYVASSRVDRNRLAVWIVLLCALGSAANLILASTQFGMGVWRVRGLFGGPNLLPRVSIPVGLIAAAGVLVLTGWRSWFVLAIGLAGTLIPALLSGSRGAFLAVPPLLVLLVVVFWIAGRRRHAVLLAAGCILPVLALPVLFPDVWDRFTGVSRIVAETMAGGAINDVATEIRLDYYQLALVSFQQHPWLGVGWGNLGDALAAAAPDRYARFAGTAFSYHSDLANFAVGAGIVGIACLALILMASVATAVGARGEPRHRAFVVLVSLSLGAAFAIFGVTDLTFGYDLPTVFYAFVLASLAALGRPAVEPDRAA